jgi:hypothetical protein
MGCDVPRAHCDSQTFRDFSNGIGQSGVSRYEQMKDSPGLIRREGIHDASVMSRKFRHPAHFREMTSGEQAFPLQAVSVQPRSGMGWFSSMYYGVSHCTRFAIVGEVGDGGDGRGWGASGCTALRWEWLVVSGGWALGGVMGLCWSSLSRGGSDSRVANCRPVYRAKARFIVGNGVLESMRGIGFIVRPARRPIVALQWYRYTDEEGGAGGTRVFSIN